MRLAWIAASLIALAGCAEERADEPAARAEAAPREPDDAVHLGAPADLIHRARLEARGLERMPEALRARALAHGRERGTVPYAELRAHADAHASERVSYEGDVGLARSAGERLWILALRTRRDGERWIDPLYVLSVVPPHVPPVGGVRARIDGWVAGERTIGHHALPLVVAFHVEPLADGPARGE